MQTQPEYVSLTPQEQHDVDLLITRLEYLAEVRRARIKARKAIEQHTHTEISTEELDRLLSTGDIAS